MASVFSLLEEIRNRPDLYVGGDEFHRILQLQNLEQLLCGYSLALRQHRIEEPVADFVRDFSAYLRETKRWSTSCGPVDAIIEATKSDVEAWEVFWALVDEFRHAVDVR